MRRPTGSRPGGPGPESTALVAVPIVALVSRPGSVDLSSFSPGTVALMAGLALSFLAPVAIAILLLAGGDRNAGGERTTRTGASGRSAGSERAQRDEHTTARGTTDESAGARTGQSASIRRAGRRPDRSKR